MKSQKSAQNLSKFSRINNEQASQSQGYQNSSQSQNSHTSIISQDIPIQQPIKVEQPQPEYTTKSKKKTKIHKNIHKQNLQSSSRPTRTCSISMVAQQDLQILRLFLLAQWAQCYIDVIGVSYSKNFQVGSLADQVMGFDITSYLTGQLGINVTEDVGKLIKQTRTEMQKYFIPEQGVPINLDIFSKNTLSKTSQINLSNHQTTPNPQNPHIFSFSPTRIVTGKIFYRLCYQQCSDTIIYGRQGIGKSTSFILYIMLSQYIHQYRSLERSRTLRYGISGDYKKVFYWCVEEFFGGVGTQGWLLKVVRNLVLALRNQCQEYDIQPEQVILNRNMSLQDYQFEVLRNLCEEIKNYYKNVYIFVDQFDVIVSVVQGCNKKLDQLLRSSSLKQYFLSEKILILQQKLKNREINLRQYEISAFYIKILQIFRKSKIGLIFNSSKNIEQKYLRNIPSGPEEFYQYIQIGTSSHNYQKIKIEYQELKKSWIVQQMVHLFKFWMRYKLAITEAQVMGENLSPIKYLKDQKLRKNMAKQKIINLLTPAIVFDAINSQTPFLQDQLTMKQYFNKKCDKIFLSMRTKVRYQLRHMFNLILTKKMNQQSNTINILLILKYFDVGDENTLTISLKDLFKNVNDFKAQLFQVGSMLDLGVYTVCNKEIRCVIKGKYFRREFVSFLATLPAGLSEQIVYKIMAILPESKNGLGLEDYFILGLNGRNSFFSPEIEFKVTKKIGFNQFFKGQLGLKKQFKHILQHLTEQQQILAIPFQNELYQQYNKLETQEIKNKYMIDKKITNSDNIYILVQKSQQSITWNFILLTTKSRKQKIQERFNNLMKIISNVKEFNHPEQSKNHTVRVFVIIRPNIVSQSMLLSELRIKTKKVVDKIVKNFGNIVVNLEKTWISLPQTSIHAIFYNWITENNQGVIELGQKVDFKIDNDDSSSSLN